MRPLTHAENEILRLLAHGLERKQVAQKLNRSPHTIAAHSLHICLKLNATNIRHAVAIAISRSIIQLEAIEGEL